MKCVLVIMAAGCLALPSFAARPRVDVVTTDRAPLAAAGVVNVEGSTGSVNIIGWDQPEVVVVATRSTFPTDAKDRATDRLNRVHVALTAAGAGELTISTKKPYLRGVYIDYQIMVPRTARLVVRQGTGDVVITKVEGDIDAKARNGDLLVQLPEPGRYTIHAKSRLGGVYSDFKDSPVPADSDAAAPAHKVDLRIGVGGITIQRMDA
jgi:hypothetical protein